MNNVRVIQVTEKSVKETLNDICGWISKTYSTNLVEVDYEADRDVFHALAVLKGNITVGLFVTNGSSEARVSVVKYRFISGSWTEVDSKDQRIQLYNMKGLEGFFTSALSNFGVEPK